MVFTFYSEDGSVKIWDENKILISEFLLDDSLNAACFLGDAGDVVISFKNHIFYIDKKKGKLVIVLQICFQLI